MDRVRSLVINVLWTVGSSMIHAGRWIHEWGQKLDTSPKLDLDEMIGGVDVHSTPFGDLLMKQSVLDTIRPNDPAPEISQFQQVTDELKPKARNGSD